MEKGLVLVKQNRELEQLIENRPEQLRDLLSASAVDECERLINANPGFLRRTRMRVTTEEEGLRRTRASKNLYEYIRRSHVTTPGWIELDFAKRSDSFLLDPYHPPPPTCLDEIFHGRTVKMCGDGYCLQSLFGIDRKKLSAAGSGVRRGRETFYDYRAVLACMEALIRQTGPGAHWLPDTEPRRIVLTSILFRARQGRRLKSAKHSRKLFDLI